MKDELDSLKSEKQGIYRDLKSEREVRQRLEATLQELQARGQGGEFDLEEMADDDYLTAGQVKKLIKGIQGKSDRETQSEAKQRANENYAADEERMVGPFAMDKDEWYWEAGEIGQIKASFPILPQWFDGNWKK